MKSSSMRKIDVRDVAFLASYLGLRTAAEIVAVRDEHFPTEPLGDAQRAQLKDIEMVLASDDAAAAAGLDDVVRRARELRYATGSGSVGEEGQE